jgi:hypothetical protein
MTDLFEITEERGSEIILYEGGAIGYQLFEFDEGLEKRIVDWVAEKLAVRQVHSAGAAE